eukprot:TRINITY_DN6070_c0_g1_i2.p1 TRINITY_DN6070_c0_g1~~TRINITY_DN6070_c0_g1_i2.p1  ORF type:complete len:161 (-),score=23.04 TRINITY_DN6070_c0_g1_i2:250-732(-)
MALWPPGYLDVRRAELERFLNRINEKSHLRESAAFRVFMVRPLSQFEEGKKEVESHLHASTRTFLRQFHILKDNFAKILDKELPGDSLERIGRIKDFVVKSHNNLAGLYESGTKLNINLEKISASAQEFAQSIKNVREAEKHTPKCTKDRLGFNVLDVGS